MIAIESLLDLLKKNYYMNSCISVLDNKQAVIENCKTILECSDILVRIISSDYLIELWGNDLSASNYSSKTVLVEGEIQSVTFSKRRRSE